MGETRKLAAILCSDVVGYSRLAGADEDRILARLRALRSDLIDPTIAVHHGRIVKRTGDGSIVEFRSVVDAVRCAIEVQNAMVERNAGVPEDRRIVFRIGIHLGDVVEESDGDLMGDGVNIAARLEGIAEPGAICLSEDAYRQVKGRLDLAVIDLGPTQLKNIAEPIRAYSLQVGVPAQAKPATEAKPPEPKKRSMLASLVAGIVALVVVAGGAWYFLAGNRAAPVVANRARRGRASLHRRAALHQSLRRSCPGLFRRRHHRKSHHRSLAHPQQLRHRAQHGLHLQGQNHRRQGDRQGARRSLCARRLGAARPEPGARQRPADRRRNPARISGPTASRKTSPTCSSCRIEVVARLANSAGFRTGQGGSAKRRAHPQPRRDRSDHARLGFADALLPKRTKDKINAARALFEQALRSTRTMRVRWRARPTYMVDKVFGWADPDVDYDAKVVGLADRSIAIDPEDACPGFHKEPLP